MKFPTNVKQSANRILRIRIVAQRCQWQRNGHTTKQEEVEGGWQKMLEISGNYNVVSSYVKKQRNKYGKCVRTYDERKVFTTVAVVGLSIITILSVWIVLKGYSREFIIISDWNPIGFMTNVRLDKSLRSLSCWLDALMPCYATSWNCNPESTFPLSLSFLSPCLRVALSSDVNDFKDAQ